MGILVYWSIAPSFTFTTDAANTSRNQTNTQATLVFTLLPILAVVVIGGVMIAAVMRFGGG